MVPSGGRKTTAAHRNTLPYQVSRLAVKNDRYILMEKRLELKRQPWKVTKVDINTTNCQEASMALRDMQDAIDRYLDQRDNETQGHQVPKK